MTFRSTINSKNTQREFLKRGFKSMFSNYEEKNKTTPPVDTENGKEKQSSSN